jgi:Domain of unknown function (DUF4397)
MSRLLPAGVAACCALVVFACDLGSPAPAQVRMANFVPDAPSAIDLCIKPATDAAYTTPFVGNGGLAFPALSSRVQLDAGTYSVRVVPGGSTNCNSSFNGLGDISGVQLGEGGTFTLAAIGRLSGTGQGSFALSTFPDDVSSPGSGLKLRYVNVAPEVDSADIWVAGALTPEVSNLTYTSTSNPAYKLYNTPPSAPEFLAISPTGSNSVILDVPGVALPNGSVSTLWLVGRPNVSGAAHLSFFLSADNVNSSQRLPP